MRELGGRSQVKSRQEPDPDHDPDHDPDPDPIPSGQGVIPPAVTLKRLQLFVCQPAFRRSRDTHRELHLEVRVVKVASEVRWR